MPTAGRVDILPKHPCGFSTTWTPGATEIIKQFHGNGSFLVLFCTLCAIYEAQAEARSVFVF